MSTLIFIASCFLLALILVSRMPGLEHFVKPIVGLLFKALEATVTSLWAWLIYILKTLMYSHVELLRHLLLSSETIDPSMKMREETLSRFHSQTRNERGTRRKALPLEAGKRPGSTSE